MRWLGISLIALAATLAGFYLSFLYFDEPLPASRCITRRCRGRQ